MVDIKIPPLTLELGHMLHIAGVCCQGEQGRQCWCGSRVHRTFVSAKSRLASCESCDREQWHLDGTRCRTEAAFLAGYKYAKDTAYIESKHTEPSKFSGRPKDWIEWDDEGAAEAARKHAWLRP